MEGVCELSGDGKGEVGWRIDKKISGWFYGKTVTPGGWVERDSRVVAFSCVFNSDVLPRGLQRRQEVEVCKIRRWGNRGLVGFDPLPTVQI